MNKKERQHFAGAHVLAAAQPSNAAVYVRYQIPSYSRIYLMTASEKPSIWVQFP